MVQWKYLTTKFQREWKVMTQEQPTGTSADELERHGGDPKFRFYFQLTYLKPFKKQRK
jgi:hypothetical protein